MVPRSGADTVMGRFYMADSVQPSRRPVLPSWQNYITTTYLLYQFYLVSILTRFPFYIIHCSNIRTYISFKLAKSYVYILFKLFNMICTLGMVKGMSGWAKMAKFHEKGRFVSFFLK